MPAPTNTPPLVGIDLGGTKIEIAIVDPTGPGEAVFRTRIPTGAENGYDHIVGRIAELVDRARTAFPGPFPSRIGIGTPGTLDPKTSLLRGANTQCLNGRPLKADLERTLGAEVEIANDANCFALAEATLGAAAGYPTVFGVILGTGCGGGFVVGGKALYGCHGIAGEWGQVVIDPEGDLSGYGTRGTIETILAGPALEKFYARSTGAALGLREIAARHADGSDPAATATVERLIGMFAKAVAIVIDTFDPHAIVIGGGVGNIPDLYTDATRARIAGEIFAPTFEAALLKPALGDSAGVFGAAMLVA